MKSRLFAIIYGIIKCSLVVFVQLLSTGNNVHNFRVPEFGRFLKDTWKRYGMAKYMYKKEFVCSYGWDDKNFTRCVCATFIYMKPCT